VSRGVAGLLCRRLSAVAIALALGLAPAHAEEPPEEPRPLAAIAPGPIDAGKAIVTPPPSQTADRTITLILVGDTGFNRSLEPVKADGVDKHGAWQTWRQTLSGVRELIDADLAFANLETVVTDRNDLRPDSKAFNFRSHPNAVRELARAGFNLLSLANNHVGDYGIEGVRETLRHLEPLAREGVKGWAGAGLTREQAIRPAIAEVKGARVALSALGIGHLRAGDGRPGQATPYGDFDDVAALLADARAGYRILSIHQGLELRLDPDPAQMKRWREAVRDYDLDLIAGHHSHVAQGVEQIGGRLIFYGLGNFLHHGTQNMGALGLCRDWGMLARLHLLKGEDGRLAARAVEVVPLYDMHVRTVRLGPEKSRERIHALNALSARLDDARSGARGLRFAPQADGRGLWCAPGAGEEPGRLGALCRAYAEPAPPSREIAGRIQSACGVQVARGQRREREEAGEGESGKVRRAAVRRSVAQKAAPGFLSSLLGN
jgi:poly-gamma-glutamate synthesis protein (capsule biosynthesis protein)